MEVRTDFHDVMAIKPNFLTLMGYHIFLAMVLRAGAPPLKMDIPQSCRPNWWSWPGPKKDFLPQRVKSSPTQGLEDVNGVVYPTITKRVRVFRNVFINAGALGVEEVINSAPLGRVLFRDHSYRVTLELK